MELEDYKWELLKMKYKGKLLKMNFVNQNQFQNRKTLKVIEIYFVNLFYNQLIKSY